MSRRPGQILFFIAVLATAFYFSVSQYSGWARRFGEVCPNRDTLLWDANIRFIQALDAVDDARQGIVLPALRETLASPTWPPLRVWFSEILLSVHGSPDTVLDMLPSSVFLFALIPLFGFFSFSFPGSFGRIDPLRALFNGALFLASVFLLFGLADLPRYVFSSMLEIQGMFFFTWNAWTIWLLYRRADQNDSFSVSPYLKASFFLSGLGLYMTKYPYGILIGLPLLAVEMLRSPRELLLAGMRVFRERYRGWRLVLFALPGFAVVLIVLGPYIARDLVGTRIIKNLLYLALLGIFLDFNYYLWKRRPDFFPKTIRFLYLWFLLPFAALVLSHPDRFGSLIQAQTDRVAGSRIYLLSLFDDYFLQNHAFSALVLGGLALALLSWPAVAGRPFVRSLWNRISSRSFVAPSANASMLVFLWCNIFVMEFLTSNHQARYLFQILPLFLFFHGNLFWTAFARLPFPKSLREIAPTVAVLMIAVAAFIPLREDHNPSTRDVCFAMMDRSWADGARRLAAWLPADTNAILMNDFHASGSASTGRAQATEIDLFLRMKVWGMGHIRTDSRYGLSDWSRFSRVLHVTMNCSVEGETELRKRSDRMHVVLERTGEYSDPSGICAVIYRIQR